MDRTNRTNERSKVQNPACLEASLKEAARFQRTNRTAAFHKFDILYMQYGEEFRSRIQPYSQDFHADITETVEFQTLEDTHQIVRREAQALERMKKPGCLPGYIRPSIRELGETGNIYQLGLDHMSLKRIPQELYQLPQLRGLVMNGNKLTTLNGMPNLSQLQTLYINQNQLSNLEGLPNLLQLKGLYLIGNPITSLRGLPSLPKLKTFDLSRNPIAVNSIGIHELRDRGVEVRI